MPLPARRVVMPSKPLQAETSSRIAALPPMETLATGLIAVLVVQVFRSTFHSNMILLVIEAIVQIGLPLILLARVSKKS